MTQKISAKKYNQSALIAKHFGFDVEDQLEVSSEAIKLAKTAKKDAKYFDNHMPAIEEVTEMLLKFKDLEKEKGIGSLFYYYDQPANGNHTKQRKRPGEDQVSLHMLGVEDSIAESIMIKTIALMLSESGIKKFTLHLNNIGGKEAQTQFNREATNFFRKNISLLNANCRQFLKQGIHTLVTEGGSQCKVLKEHAPEPMDFLSEETRKKFTELIERIESFDFPYEINPDVLGDLNYSNYTTFHFIDDESGKVVAAGTRYNLLAKKIGIRKEIPAISANIWIKNPKYVSAKSLEKIENCKIFLLQIGQTARTFALEVLEKLWKEKIHVKNALTKDRLTPQIILSKKVRAEHLMIIGHKEALDRSIMYRDSEGKSQKILTPEELIEILKQKI